MDLESKPIHKLLKVNLAKSGGLVGLDFNHSGKMIVAINQFGGTVVTDVDMNGGAIYKVKLEACNI